MQSASITFREKYYSEWKTILSFEVFRSWINWKNIYASGMKRCRASEFKSYFNFVWWKWKEMRNISLFKYAFDVVRRLLACAMPKENIWSHKKLLKSSCFCVVFVAQIFWIHKPHKRDLMKLFVVSLASRLQTAVRSF